MCCFSPRHDVTHAVETSYLLLFAPYRFMWLVRNKSHWFMCELSELLQKPWSEACLEVVTLTLPVSLLVRARRQWDKSYSCYRSRQTLTSQSDSVLGLMRIAHARLLSDTTHCPMMTPQSVRRQSLIWIGAVTERSY